VAWSYGLFGRLRVRASRRASPFADFVLCAVCAVQTITLLSHRSPPSPAHPRPLAARLPKRLPESPPSSPLACTRTVRHDMRPCRGLAASDIDMCACLLLLTHTHTHIHTPTALRRVTAMDRRLQSPCLQPPASGLQRQPPPASLPPPPRPNPTDPPLLPLFVSPACLARLSRPPVALGVGAVPSPRHVPLMRLSTTASLLQLDAAAQNKPSPAPAPCITEPLKPCASCEHDASG
jgi:hypothetical protein